MNILKQRRHDRVTRQEALKGVPLLNPGVRLETTADGVRRVEVVRPRGTSFFERMRPRVINRDYELDEFGGFVIDLVDGERSVGSIIDAFEERFAMSRRECELSVVAFIKMLMQRHVLSVAVARERETRSASMAAIVLLAGATLALPAAAQEADHAGGADEPTALDHLKALYADKGPIAPGTPGNLALEAHVRQQFEASGFETGTLRFDAPVLRPGDLTLDCGAAGRFTLDAMHPTLMRPGNFPTNMFTAQLVYLGDGSPEALDAADGTALDGAIAVMDYGCGDSWMHLLRFGLAGIVFVGAGDEPHLQAVTKIYTSEVATPRFYIDGEAGKRLLALMKADGAVEARAEAVHTNWEPSTLRDLWVLIPGADPVRSEKLVVITAALDAASVVPARATGGQRSINLFLLLQLLEDFKANRPAHSVLLTAVNARTQRYAGDRALAWHLLGDEKRVEARRDEIAGEMRLARLYTTEYGQLQLLPVPESEQADLHVMIEILNVLHTTQQAARRSEHEKQLEEADDDSEVPGPDTVLDLQPIGAPELEAAMAGARIAIIDGYSGFFATRGQDPAEIAAYEAADLAVLEKLAAMPFDAFMAKARRIKHVFDDEQLFESWRAKLDETTGRRVYVKGKLQDEFKSRLNRTTQSMMLLSSSESSDLPETVRSNQVAELSITRDDLRKVLVLFNKIDIGVGRSRTRYREIATSEPQRRMLKAAVGMFVEKYAAWQEQYARTLDEDVANGVIRRVTATRQPALVISLELDGIGDRFGFSNLARESNASGPSGFGDICLELATAGAAETGGSRSPPLPYVDTIGSAIERKAPYFFTMPESSIDYYHAAQQTPAVALKSPHSPKGALFGPDDTVAKLDAENIGALQANVRAFLGRLLDHEEAFTKDNLDMGIGKGLYSWSLQARTYSLEQFTGKPIPTTDVPGCLVMMYDRSYNKVEPSLVNGQVVNCFMAISDATANAYFVGLGERRRVTVLAYKLDPGDGSVAFALDKGRVQSSKQINSNVQRSSRVTMPMFECREFRIADRIDPTLLSNRPVLVSKYWPKTAKGQSTPDRYGFHGGACLSPVWSHLSSGPAAVYMYKKAGGFIQDDLMVITDDKRCVLNATEAETEGEGFASDTELGADFFGHAARDMAVLNVSRNAQMKGVVNQLVDQFLAEGGRLIDAARTSLSNNAHMAYVQQNYEALGREVQAHGELRKMNADMLKAIVVYMALMLPFCFFLEKLLFNFKRIEHALGAFSVLFVMMYTLFRFIHPAFRIAMSPEAIFIAFVLGAIGCFTASVLNARFAGEMQVILRGMGGIGEQASYSTVGQTAMLIGVQNMRRRRIRTTLTTATIVLVVFTMLAFSSVSRQATPTLIKKTANAIYTGLMFHWPAGAPMDKESVGVIRNLFHGRANVTTRTVLEADDAFHLERVSDPEVSIEIAAITGLHPDDRAVQGSMAIIEGDAFSSPTANEILLPLAAADALGIGARDVGSAKVRLLGHELLVRGLLHDERYRAARDLNPNLPLVPMKKDDQARKKKKDDADGEKDIAPFELSKLMLETGRLAIVPVGLSEQLGASPSAVSVVFPDDTDGAALGEEISRLLKVAPVQFYAGSRQPFSLSRESEGSIEPGVYYIGSSYRTAIGGLAKLIIPLIIAGSIILNTMLGTVYERKSEIAVFNAIGLNPTHIFFFFLAEAVVYSFIGSVGGYLIGQVLTVALKSAGLIQNVNINFSSLMVVYAILFTMALVVLSTLYPGYVATRTAVPSGQRKWSMPEHDGNTMTVIFPFIYRPRMAFGAMAYLYAYFEPLSEQSLGDIIANVRDTAVSTDDAGRTVLSLSYAVALAPYDLGVTETVTFCMRYDDVVSSYRVHMTIDRVSGRDTNWVTTNKPFLTRVRKYLLRWRNIDPTRQQGFVEAAAGLFDAPLPDGDRIQV